MSQPNPPSPLKWAQLRHVVVGPLMASPPKPGELQARIEELTRIDWLHPRTGKPLRFGYSTIERWYYHARHATDPVLQLIRKVRQDRGSFDALSAAQRDLLRAQYHEHPGWTARLHTDNLHERTRLDPTLGGLPSTSTVYRFLRSRALPRRRRRGRGQTPGTLLAEQRLFTREVRSYEHTHVGALWHLDFHCCSRQVLTAQGEWVTPQLIAFIDDHSRLICHAQWYLAENSENLVHALTQAIAKRGLARAFMTDRGGAMTSAEVKQGIERIGSFHDLTLPYSPDQNAKPENFWNAVENRLMAMIEGEPVLTLLALNEATHAWIECEYHRTVHSETQHTPIDRFLNSPSVLRPSPTMEELRNAFLAEVERTQRRSDGTIRIDSRRFELPNRFRHLRKVHVRYASWDLSRALLIDPRTQVILATLHPIDKNKNADGRRRLLDPVAGTPGVDFTRPPEPSGIAPLLRRYIEEHAATGLPAPYIPTAAEIESDPATEETES